MFDSNSWIIHQVILSMYHLTTSPVLALKTQKQGKPCFVDKTVQASSFSANVIEKRDRGSSYSSRQKSSGIQLYLIVKLVRPASRISFSRSNTQLRPSLRDRTITLSTDTAEYTRTFAQKFRGIKFPRLPDVWK